MKKNIGFYFNPKQWLGDHAIIAMDWDCRAIHLHFMCMAWQQTKKGYLLNDDKKLRKLVNNPDLTDWTERIKPQVFGAWKSATIDGKEYFYLQGLLDSYEELKALNKEFRKVAKQNEQDMLKEESNQGLLDLNVEEDNSDSITYHEQVSTSNTDSALSEFDNVINDSIHNTNNINISHHGNKNRVNRFTKRVMPEEITDIASIAEDIHQENDNKNSAFNLENLNQNDKNNAKVKFSIRRKSSSENEEINLVLNDTQETQPLISKTKKTITPTLTEEEIQAREERRETIWTLGIKMLTTDDFGESKVRGFLGKLVKEHGEANLAKAISQILIKDLRPIEAKSFLMGTLKKIEKDTKKATSRGKVAL
jgi:hypothetical protein